MIVQEEADKLRQEAKDLLREQFRLMSAYNDIELDRFVDCIIHAAILEVAMIQDKIEFERIDYMKPIGG